MSRWTTDVETLYRHQLSRALRTLVGPGAVALAACAAALSLTGANAASLIHAVPQRCGVDGPRWVSRPLMPANDPRQRADAGCLDIRSGAASICPLSIR